MAKQQTSGLFGEVRDGLLILLGEFLQEMVDEERDVLPSLPQRGKRNGDDVEAVVKVLSEQTRPPGLFKIPMGRREDSHVRLEGGVRSQSLKLLLLKDSEELDLSARGEVADLIEKDRAPIGLLKPADPSLEGSCESALLMSKEFAFEERSPGGRRNSP